MRRDRRLCRASNSGYLLISSKPAQSSDMATPSALARNDTGLVIARARDRPGGHPSEASTTLQLFLDAFFDRRQESGGIGAVVRNGKPGDGRVDQRRLARRQRGAERGLELAQAVDAKALGAARLGVGDVVRVVEFDQAGLVERLDLIKLDELVLAVMENNPDDGEIVSDRGHQLETGQQITAVAAADDDRPVGKRHLGAERAVHRPVHWPEAARLAVILAALELQVIAEPGEMGAGISQYDGVVRQ